MEFLYSKDSLPHGRASTAASWSTACRQQSIPRTVRRGLYALAECSARAELPGHGRLRALAVGPHLAGLVDRGVRFRPQIVLAAPAPFHTLWEAERVARRSGAALALMPCLHADPQVDHPSLLRLLRRADAVLTMTDYEGRVPDQPGRRPRSGAPRGRRRRSRRGHRRRRDRSARDDTGCLAMRPSCSSPAVRARERASRP